MTVAWPIASSKTTVETRRHWKLAAADACMLQQHRNGALPARPKPHTKTRLRHANARCGWRCGRTYFDGVGKITFRRIYNNRFAYPVRISILFPTSRSYASLPTGSKCRTATSGRKHDPQYATNMSGLHNALNHTFILYSIEKQCYTYQNSASPSSQFRQHIGIFRSSDTAATSTAYFRRRYQASILRFISASPHQQASIERFYLHRHYLLCRRRVRLRRNRRCISMARPRTCFYIMIFNSTVQVIKTEGKRIKIITGI